MTNKKNSIGFWCRFAALWIDTFAIYSITKFIIVLLSLIDFRISFGILFIFIGALYSTIMLSLQRQTLGKMLMQIIVTSNINKPINIRYILLREVFGKWGITVFMPLMLGQILVETIWLPTIFDILIMLPIIFLCIIYYLFTKKMWYEHLSGLTVKRILIKQKIKIGFWALMITAFLGIGTTLIEYLVIGRVPCRMSAFQNSNSTKPYINFLNEQNTNPVDYVIGLFDKYDVVVLCERAHPEMTQWDFIYDIIRNPKFIDKVGNVFTEYGHVGMQDYMNKFMETDSLDETEIHKHILHITRNMPVWPSWTNYNLYKYLKRLYKLNQTLSPEKRIKHHFTDAAVDWSMITTKKQFEEYTQKYVWNRDEIMANKIIEIMDSLSKSVFESPKCLVIMNYRHAMDLTDRLPNVKRVNTYEFLKDNFENHIANVLINQRIIASIPIANGVWDAAFEKCGNKQFGFDFQGSPFGNCFFDLYPFDILFKSIVTMNTPASKGDLRYRDVFTGFVFTHPTKDQYFQINTPGYFDGFEDEYIRRLACLSDEDKVGVELEIESIKNENHDSIQKNFGFKIETIIELFFYCFSGIGLLIGFVVYIFRSRKIIVENDNL